MSDENIEVTEIESPFLQRAGEKLYSYKFPTKASLVSMTDGTSVEDAVSSAQETLGETTAEELAAAVAEAHAHENKEDVLDALGVNSDGKLTFNGTVVAGSGSGGGDSGDTGALTEEVEELKETVEEMQTTVEAQATAIASLTEQIAALQAALDAIDLSAYMPISGGQFTGAYYGTTVTADDGVIDLSKGSIYTATVNGDAFEVSFSGAVGASCFTLELLCEEDCDVLWPDSVRWPDGEAPEIVAGVNVVTFISPDAGATWYGSVNGTDYKSVEE